MQNNLNGQKQPQLKHHATTEKSEVPPHLNDPGLESLDFSGTLYPNTPAENHYLTIEGPGINQTIPLEAATYSIGRHVGNAIVINNNTVSGQHAILLRLNGLPHETYAFRIIDGNFQGSRSRNGLWINGNRCHSHDLQDQDVIHIGPEVQARYHCNLASFSNDIDPTSFALRPPEDRDRDAHRQLRRQELQMLGDQALIRLSSFIELIPYPIFEINLSGQITYLNPAAIEQFPDLKHDRQHPLLQNLLSLELQTPQKHLAREVRVGESIFEQVIHYLIESNLVRSYLVDITQRIQAEQRLSESEDRYAAAAEGANDGLWDWNLSTDRIYFSLRWKAMLGYDEADIGDRPEEWFGRLHPDDEPTVREQLAFHLSGAAKQFQTEFRLLTRLGEYRWFRCRGLARRNESGAPYRLSGSLTDITDYYSVKQQLLEDSLRDALTGLPNRHLFMMRLKQAFARNQMPESARYGVLFLDLDRFKVVNDSLGHLLGDEMLLQVAARLTTCLRDRDIVARFGGDEFVILLESIESVDDALAIAERIQQQMSTCFFLEQQEVFTGASIGIAISGPHYQNPEDILRDADAAMYRAKRSGISRYEIVNGDIHTGSLALLQMDSDLRRAIERQEFFLVYQPIVSFATGNIAGFEALIRWQHPERGLVPPSDFIPLAEDTGFILPLGDWVLQQACRQMRLWQIQYPSAIPLTIHVNVSSKQFAQPDFVGKIRDVLCATELAYGSLKLEITEGVIMQHEAFVAQQLNTLKTLGVCLGIDDFGTGYSSLKYLNSFPLDTLKIDRSFVSQMESNDSLEIVRTIVNLAHNLKMEVVAEGVETLSQAALLQKMGCEYAQGYFFAKPLDEAAASNLLKSGVRAIAPDLLLETPIVSG
ncbi:EAL domain-containing protein [Altericista sp. CCNU0014]|uniref:EAL domain-containing protein n=1 Tax=Altericista sp. CCNU0014 TaxID=3082949 RepID=UPI00384DDD65